MKSQTIRTNEKTLRPFFGRPAPKTTHNPTGAASVSTVATTHDHKEVNMKTQVDEQRNGVAGKSNLCRHISTKCLIAFAAVILGAWPAMASNGPHPFNPYQWTSASCAGSNCTWIATSPFPTITASSSNGWVPGGSGGTNFTPPLMNEFNVFGNGASLVINFPSSLNWGANGGELIFGNIHNYFEYNLSATDGTNPINVNTWTFLGEDLNSTSSTSTCIGGTYVGVLPNGTCAGGPYSKSFYVYDSNASTGSGQGGVVAIGNLPSNVRTITLTLESNNLGDMFPNGGQGSDFIIFNVGAATTTLKGGCVAPPSGMVAWYSFDQTGSVQDDLAKDNNASAYGTQSVTGEVSKALLFDGTDDYVQAPNQSWLNMGTGNLSIDAWVKISSPADDLGVAVLVDKRQSSPILGYHFFLYGGQLGLQLADSSGYSNYLSTTTVPADNHWHLIAVTVVRKSHTGGVWYLDGRPIDKPFDPTDRIGSLNSDATLDIGVRQSSLWGGGSFKGGLDELEIFNRALSPAEVLSLYRAGSLGKCK